MKLKLKAPRLYKLSGWLEVCNMKRLLQKEERETLLTFYLIFVVCVGRDINLWVFIYESLNDKMWEENEH